MRRPRLVLVAVTGLAAAASLIAAAALGGPPERTGVPAAQAGDLLPDLDLLAPRTLAVEARTIDGKRRFLLSFASAAENVGAGPLVVEGRREGVSTPRMTADQIVFAEGGEARRIPGVGQLEYVRDPTHDHWHLLSFMSYELRTPAGKVVRPDSKTGFCLGDRYASERWGELPAREAAPVFLTNCGLGETDLLGLTEGISVGYGDNYERWRDSQWIDVTGVPGGTYLLVHRVNADRSLLERSHANNTSSLRISLTWPKGTKSPPRVRVLATCPDTARCPAPRR